MKQSKKGNLTLVKAADGSFLTKSREEIRDTEVFYYYFLHSACILLQIIYILFKQTDMLVEVFRDGEMVQEWSFQEIRNRISAEL